MALDENDFLVFYYRRNTEIISDPAFRTVLRHCIVKCTECLLGAGPPLAEEVLTDTILG